MDSLVNYGSEDEYDCDNSRQNTDTRQQAPPSRGRDMSRTPPQHQPRRDDDTNYDDVTMDMSEDSYSGDESPQRDTPSPPPSRNSHADGLINKAHETDRKSTDRNYSRDCKEDREGYHRGERRDSSSKDDRRKSPQASLRRGLLGDRPGDPNTMVQSAGYNPAPGMVPRPSTNHGSSDSRPGGLGSESNSRSSSSRYGDLGNSARGGSGSEGGLGSASGAGRPPPLMELRPFGENPLPSSGHHDRDDKSSYGNKSRDSDSKERSSRHEKDSSDRRDRDKDADRDRKYERDRHSEKDRHSERDRHTDRDKERHGDRDKDRSDRDRDRHSDRDRRHHDEKRSSTNEKRRDRSRSRDRTSSSHRRRSPSGERDRDRDRRHIRTGDSSRRSNSQERRSKRSNSHEISPIGGDYKPSYKVSKKLQAMEKMGLQIKTPDGSMATAQMLMQRTLDEQVEKVKNATGIELPKYYNPAIMNPLKYAEQIQKRKLLWGNKSKETEVMQGEAPSQSKPNSANKWQGAKFAQDNDGKVASKFLRLMGVKDPNVVQAPPQTEGDIVKKQEEMFQAMQAQYDVARATTHTMRGVGLGFSNMHRQY